MNYLFCMVPAPLSKPTKIREGKYNCTHLPGKDWEHRESVNWLFSDGGGHCDCWPTACLHSSVSLCHIPGCWKMNFIYLQNYRIMLPVQIISKIVLLFHWNPALFNACRVEIRLWKRLIKDVYFLERSLIFCLLVCFQRISCWGGELGKCFEQSFSRNKQSIWKAHSSVCWW